MGSTNWGHQRKAVALIKTLPKSKSSLCHKKIFSWPAVLSQTRPDDDDKSPRQG